MIENLTAKITGADSAKKILGEYGRKADKAMGAAVRVELFRLRKEIQSGLRKGAPGGRNLKRLTAVSRYDAVSKRFRSDLPFSGRESNAIKHIRYDYNARTQSGEVGWTAKTAPRIRTMAGKYQKGFRRSITKFQRRMLARLGGGIGSRSRLRKYFFLKKDTTIFETPPRPVIQPVYDDQLNVIQSNIKTNFRLKMQGKRI